MNTPILGSLQIIEGNPFPGINRSWSKTFNVSPLPLREKK